MKDFIIVYVLASQANPAIHYTGITRDLEQRLLETQLRQLCERLAALAVVNRNRCCVQI